MEALEAMNIGVLAFGYAKVSFLVCDNLDLDRLAPRGVALIALKGRTVRKDSWVLLPAPANLAS